MNKYVTSAIEKIHGFKIGKEIGHGAEGYVYQIKKYPDRIIKIKYSGKSEFNRLNKFIEYLKKDKNKSVVKVYCHGYVDGNEDLPPNIDPIYGYHYYVMDKLKNIPKDEQFSFISAFQPYYRTKSKKKQAPTFASVKFKKFLTQANTFKYVHEDIHEGNIMMDRFGNYKLIDLESFTWSIK